MSEKSPVRKPAAKKTAPRKKKVVVPAPEGSIAWYAQQVEAAKVQGVKPKAKKSPKKAAKKKSPKKAKAAKKTKTARKTKSKSPKKVARKTKSKSPKKAAKKASPKGRGPKPLADKVAALKAGKVMDVTKYRANGEGAKVIDAPAGKSKKVVVGKIAANAQDGLVGVKAAAKALGKESLVDQWKAAKAKALAASPKKASPKRKSRSKSPKRKTSPRKKASPAAALPLSPSSPRGLPVLSNSPRGSGLPALPVVRPPTIGSNPSSPRL